MANKIIAKGMVGRVNHTPLGVGRVNHTPLDVGLGGFTRSERPGVDFERNIISPAGSSEAIIFNNTTTKVDIKAVADSVVIISFERVNSEELAVAESFSRVVSYNREFSFSVQPFEAFLANLTKGFEEAADQTEQVLLSIVKTPVDTIGLSEAIAIIPTKNVADNISTTALVSSATYKVLADQRSTSETITKYISDYFAEGYTSETYAGVLI